MSTEKNIKDYLHLYLGCEVWSENGLPYTLKPRDLERSTFESGLEKPILRPLSDMTEQERKEFHTINTVKNNKEQCEANNTVWLLSKYFDLFELIEAGLAIDKTKTYEH